MPKKIEDINCNYAKSKMKKDKIKKISKIKDKIKKINLLGINFLKIKKLR